MVAGVTENQPPHTLTKGDKMSTQEKINAWGWKINRTGLSQPEFADKAGVNYNTLQTYLRTNKRATPNAENFSRIEKALEEDND